MARFRNEPCRHNDADRGIYGGTGCGVHFHCMECGGYWDERIDPVSESVEGDTVRAGREKMTIAWTPAIENFEPEEKMFGSAETKLDNRHGDGHLRMQFNGFIYQEYGNVVQVDIVHGRDAATVFVKLNDLLDAVQWMKRIYPLGEAG